MHIYVSFPFEILHISVRFFPKYHKILLVKELRHVCLCTRKKEKPMFLRIICIFLSITFVRRADPQFCSYRFVLLNTIMCEVSLMQ